MGADLNESLRAGVVGAVSLNLIHESTRQFVPDAPKIHEVAMRATQRLLLGPIGVHPSRRNLYLTTMAGDLISNSIYYAAVVGAFRNQSSNAIWKRAVFFGLGAGVLAYTLPPLFKLGQQPTRNPAKTAALTIAWYLLGSLAAAAAYRKGRVRLPISSTL